MPEEVKTETITYTRKKRAVTKQQVTFKIDKGLLEQLNDYISRSNKKKIDIVEEALRNYLKEV